MTSRTKQIALLSLAIALLGVLLLAASISDLQLQAGTPFPGSAESGAPDQGVAQLQVQRETGTLPLLEMILGIVLLFAIVYFLVRLIGLASLRNIAWVLLGVVVLLALFSILPTIHPGEPTVVSSDTTALAPRDLPVYAVLPLGKTPAAFIQITAAGLLIGISLLALQPWRRNRRASRVASALRREAENALHALTAGKEFSNVIVRCYMHMLDTLRAERSLQRQENMTVHEFQEWLEFHGIPPEPIRGLSSLFEKARYSRDEIDANDEERAVECLKKIVEYCQEAKPGG